MYRDEKKSFHLECNDINPGVSTVTL
jgi:hypothetical protein